MDPLLEGFRSANDLVKEMITLATGILALSITFTRDVVKTTNPSAIRLLKLSWIFYLLSVCFGIWAMMAVTGMIFKFGQQGRDAILADPFGSSSIPALLQILSFITATILIINFGGKALSKNAAEEKDKIE